MIISATALYGCDENFGAKCGEGSVERDGVCEVETNGMVPTSTSGVTCGPGTMRNGDTCIAIEDMPPAPSVESMRNFACRSNRCLGNDVVTYWTRQVQMDAGTAWADHAVSRTLTCVEVAAVPGQTIEYEALLFRVTEIGRA